MPNVAQQEASEHAFDPGLLPSTQGLLRPHEECPAPSIPVGHRGTPWEQGPPKGELASLPSEGGATQVTTYPSPDTLTFPDRLAALKAAEVTRFPHFPLSFKTNQNADQHPLFVLGDQRKGKAVLWVRT